eukprot:6205135-Pleurochrysis_carterae.AAC.1
MAAEEAMREGSERRKTKVKLELRLENRHECHIFSASFARQRETTVCALPPPRVTTPYLDIELCSIAEQVSTKHGRRGILVSSPRKVGKKVLAFSPFAIHVEAKRRHLHFIAVDNTAIA